MSVHLFTNKVHFNKSSLVILIVLCFSHSLSAQRSDSLLPLAPTFYKIPSNKLSQRLLVDSIHVKPEDTRHYFFPLIKYHFPKSFTVNWDSRNSFIGDKLVDIWGINVALIHGEKRHQVTLGYYWLPYNSFQILNFLRKDNAQLLKLDYYTKTNLYFISGMYWYNFINNRDFTFSMPLEIGMGATNSSGTTLNNDLLLWRRADFFMPIQAGLYLQWKATRWVGISIQAGYRYAAIQRDIKENYNSPYYSFGLSFHSEIITDLYNWIFKKQKIESIIDVKN